MDVMNEKPRPMNESILTPSFLKRIGIGGLSIGVTTMIAFMIGYQGGNAVLQVQWRSEHYVRRVLCMGLTVKKINRLFSQTVSLTTFT